MPSASKKRRFKVTDVNSQGITVIPVDKRLEDASTVTIDAQVATNLNCTRTSRQDAYAADLYCDSEEIIINGIHVVPEFSMALQLFALVTLVGTIVIFASQTIIPNHRLDYQPR